MTETTKKKISEANKNKPKSSEHKKALSEAKLKNPNKYWSGKTFTEEHKLKLRKSKKQHYEKYKYTSYRGKYRKKLTSEERTEIYNHIGEKYSGKNNRFAKKYKIEYNGEVNIELTTISQIYQKYNLSQYKVEKILKTGKEYNGLKISLIEEK